MTPNVRNGIRPAQEKGPTQGRRRCDPRHAHRAPCEESGGVTTRGSLQMRRGRERTMRERSTLKIRVKQQGIAVVLVACWLSSSAHAQTFERVDTPGGFNRIQVIVTVADLNGDGRDDIIAGGSAERRQRDGRRPPGQAAGAGVPRDA